MTNENGGSGSSAEAAGEAAETTEKKIAQQVAIWNCIIYNVQTYQQSIVTQMGPLISSAHAQAKPHIRTIDAQGVTSHLGRAVKPKIEYNTVVMSKLIHTQNEIIAEELEKLGISDESLRPALNLNRELKKRSDAACIAVTNKVNKAKMSGKAKIEAKKEAKKATNISAATVWGEVGSGSSGSCNELHDCSYKGDYHKIPALLKSPLYDVNTVAEGGWTPLIYASMSGVPRAVKILLENGANALAVCTDGVTALIVAVEGGHSEVTRILIKAGSNFEAMVTNGDRPLHLAANHDHTAVMVELVRAGADVNSQGYEGMTPMFIAAKRGNLCAVKMLIRAKADPLLNEPNIPLDAAARHGKLDVVRELLRRYGIEGCGGESGGVRALKCAATGDHLEVMAVLTNAGVVDDGTALNRAAGKGHLNATMFLLQHHGKPDNGRPYIDNLCDVYGRTPLLTCLGSNRSSKIAQMLIANGADTTSPVPLKTKSLSRPSTPLEIIDAFGPLSNMKEEQRVEDFRRLLLRAEAIRAVSWAWPGTEKKIAIRAKKTTAHPRRMLPIMRRRASRPEVLLAALTRYNRKLDGAFTTKEDEGGIGST